MTVPRPTPQALENRIRWLDTYSMFVKSPSRYEELQAEIRTLRDEAERLREGVGEKSERR